MGILWNKTIRFYNCTIFLPLHKATQQIVEYMSPEPHVPDILQTKQIPKRKLALCFPPPLQENDLKRLHLDCFLVYMANAQTTFCRHHCSSEAI